MKKTILISTAVLLSYFANGQNFTDALRYSEMETQGTARFISMGGSFGALGGEVSGLNKNPAGIGVYRNSEFTFSTGFNVIDTESKYRGELRDDSRVNFNIPNISYIGTYKGDPNGWKNYSFGITYNRISSFNQASRLNGNTINSSIIDDYVFELNNQNAFVDDVNDFQYPFGPSEAWNILMIDTTTDGDGNVIYQPWVFSQSNTEQTRSIETTGNQSETAFTFGGNFQDRWFVGGSIGFQRVRFSREVNFTEKYTYDGPIDQTQLFGAEYNEKYSLLALGSGVNFKLGAIYRLNDAVRIGGAIHSPTFFGFSEEFAFESSSSFVNGDGFDSGESFSDFNYQLRTPSRYIGSLAYLIGQKAAINVEYEYVDYTHAKLNDSENSRFDFSAQNEGIRNTLQGTHNVRVGAEVKEGPFVFRAGFRYDDNPYNSEVAFSPNENRSTYSLGGGFRSKNYNIDIGYSTFKTEIIDQVYNTSTETAKIEEREHNLVFTVGWKW